jgi:UV excision repair protein RAD23
MSTPQDDTMSEAVKNLMDMGFPEDQVRSCLRAAFNNPDRAVEYLMNGIPANLQATANQAQANTEAATPARAPTLDDFRNHPEFNQIKALVQQNPQALPEVLRQIGERQPQLLEVIHNNREAFVKMMNEPIEAAAPAPAGGAGAGGLAGMMAGGGAPDFQQLFSPENEAELAQALNMSPDQMGAITQMLRSMPPEQLQAMMQNMAGGGGGMPGMPGMGGAGGGGGGAPPGAVTIPLSQEEMASVNRLTELGFHRNEVIQVYLACDKNEEVAANFLFENGDTNMGMGGDDAGAGGGAGGAGGNDNDDMYS